MKSRATKNIVINAFFGHILIEAISIMCLDDYKECQWSKLLQEKLSFNGNDKLPYDEARNLYLHLFEEDDLWASSLTDLFNLKYNK